VGSAWMGQGLGDDENSCSLKTHVFSHALALTMSLPMRGFPWGVMERASASGKNVLVGIYIFCRKASEKTIAKNFVIHAILQRIPYIRPAATPSAPANCCGSTHFPRKHSRT